MKVLHKPNLRMFAAALAVILLVTQVPFPARAASSGRFAFFAVTDDGVVSEPAYISYTEGQTVKQALSTSGHTFGGIETGFIHSVDGVTDNFSICYDGGQYDLTAPAETVTALWFTTNFEQAYDESLLLLVKEMASFNEATDGRKNAPDCKAAYNNARAGFLNATAGDAEGLYRALKEAEEAFEALMNSAPFRVTLAFTKSGNAHTPARVVFRDAFGNEKTVENKTAVELIRGTYTYEAFDGERGHVRGELTVEGDTVLAPEFPAGEWISEVQLGFTSGYTEAQQVRRENEGAAEATYYVPDYAGPHLFPYIVPGQDADTSTLRVYFENGVARTWKSRSTSLANVITKNSAEGTDLVLEARHNQNPIEGYEQYQCYTLHIVRVPTLTGLSVLQENGGLPLVQKETGTVGFDKTVLSYEVSTVSDTLLISADTCVPGGKTEIAGQVAESGDAVPVSLSSCPYADGRYEIEVSATQENGHKTTYRLLISKAEAAEITVLHAENEVVTAVDRAGNVTLPSESTNSAAQFRLTSGDAYSLVTCVNGAYYAKFDFTAADGMSLTAAHPKVTPWITGLEARQTSAKAESRFEMTPVFDGTVHDYVFMMGSQVSSFYLLASPSDLTAYTTTVYWKNMSLGTDTSSKVTSKTAFKSLANVAPQMGNDTGFRVEIRQNAVENGVTYYQEYRGSIHREMQLNSLEIRDESDLPILLYRGETETQGYEKSVKEYTCFVPRATTTLNLFLTAMRTNSMKDYGATVKIGETILTYDEEHEPTEVRTVSISTDTEKDEETFDIEVGHENVTAETQVYRVTVKKLPPIPTGIRVLPETADSTVFLVKQADSLRVYPDENGIFELNDTMEYVATVTAPGFKGKRLTFRAGAENSEITVTLEQAPETTLRDVSGEADWPTFRGNDENNGVVNLKTPIRAEDTYLLWAKQIGEGYSSGATGCPILVGDYLYTYAGNQVVKVDKFTGNVVKVGEMVSSSSFAINTPTYADGMIFVGLSNGRIQAFNAETLESLWLYTDLLGGQPNCQITYHNGYIYTGFWNSEVKSANFVCLNVTDEEPENPLEAKLPVWTYTGKGFYWAGAFACDSFVLVTTDDGDGGYIKGHGDVISFDPKSGEILDIETVPGVGDLRSSVCYDSATDAYYFTSKGGDFYQLRVDENGKFVQNSLRRLHLYNYANDDSNPPMSTCTPVIYKGRAYIGVSGVGQFTAYSGHNLTVIDLESFSIAYQVRTQGYPQTSGLLTTAYEADTEYIYVYFFDNFTPGKLRVIRDKAGLTEVDHDFTVMETFSDKGVDITYETGYVLFTPDGSQAQYAICSPIADSEGNIYFKNDSAQLMCLSHRVTELEVTEAPAKLLYHPGMTFDGTGLQVTAKFANGTTKDVTDLIAFTEEKLTEEDTEITLIVDLDKMLSEGRSANWVMYQDYNHVPGQTVYLPTATVDISFTAEHVDEDKDYECDICGAELQRNEFTVTVGSCVQGVSSSDGVGAVTGGGTKEKGEEATVAASRIDGFEFVGWYPENSENVYTGAPLSTSASYTFTVTEDIRLVAVYRAQKYAQLTVGGNYNTVNGVRQYSTYVGSHAVGTVITLEYVGTDTFSYWMDSVSGKVISYSPEFSFNLVSARTVRPMTKKAQSDTTLARVEFFTDYNQVLSTGVWSSTGNEGTLPSMVPGKYGYVFKYWSMDGETQATVESIKAAIPTSGGRIVLRPVYGQEEGEQNYSVTVYTVIGAETAEEGIPYTGLSKGSLLTVTAPKVEGKVFGYWATSPEAAENRALGFGENFTFVVSGNRVLYAIYADEAPEKRPTITMMDRHTTGSIEDGTAKVCFMVTRSVPETYEVMEAGILASGTPKNATEMVIDGEGVKKYASGNTDREGTASLNVAVKTNAAFVVYARGYMIVKHIASGEIETVYTDVVHGNFANPMGE